MVLESAKMRGEVSLSGPDEDRKQNYVLFFLFNLQSGACVGVGRCVGGAMKTS